MAHEMMMDAKSKNTPETHAETQRAVGPDAAPLRRIRVLQFLNSTVRGGVEEGVLSLLRCLDRTRFSTSLVCTPSVREAYGRELDELQLAVHTLSPLSRPYQVGTIAKLARILRASRPDVVHTHLFSATLCVAPLARVCAVPVVVESCRLREGWRKGLWRSYWVDRLVNRFVDVNIAISESLCRYLTEKKKLPANKVALIRNGRELDRLLSRPGRPEADLRRTFGLEPGDLVVIVPGRLEPQKGHAFLLEALPSVLRSFPRLRVLIAGEGSLRAQIAQQIQQLGLQRCAVLTGYSDEVFDLMRLSDLVVLPSLYEGLPLVAIEAGALGKAVLATGVDGTPEVILHGATGWLVSPANVSELARGIHYLLGQPELRKRLGEAAREYVFREYSFERVVRQTEELYLKLLSPERGLVESCAVSQA